MDTVRRTGLVLSVMCAFLFNTSFAQALTLEFLRNSVVAKFNAEDMELSKKTIAEVLESDIAGETRHWSNEQSGSSGSVVFSKTFQYSGLPCKVLKIVHRHDAQTNTSKHSFCKTKEGQWKVL